jgi:hypothetical protein
MDNLINLMEIMGENLMSENDVSVEQILVFCNFLNTRKWSDDEINNLPKKYTKNSIHIALENADKNNDKENFFKILNRDDKKYRNILKAHLHLTTFNYNFYDKDADEFIEN